MFTLSFHSITLSLDLGKFSLDRVYSWFGKYSNQVVIEKEYQVKKPIMLTINNIDGDISITTEWKRDSIYLKATKKTAKEDELDSFTVKARREERFDGNHLTLATACANKNAKGAIEYNLVVPHHTSLNLHTNRGKIYVDDINGRIAASTVHGPIQLSNIGGNITVKTEETGPIYIDKARGTIKAASHKGNIIINDAMKSIIANTQRGDIITECQSVPSNGRIILNSESTGAITLALPSTVNATLQGKTSRGRLTSDHYITIKPFTTKLTKQTRKELEKQVDGILGTGEADIRLTSNNGNIQILETKTT